WGVMGLLLARLIHPPVEALIFGLPPLVLLSAGLLLSAAFVCDVTISVRAALDLAKVLEELDRLREQSAELRRQLSETAMVELTRLSYRVDEARGEWSERMDEAREQFAGYMDDTREQVADAKEQLLARLDEVQRRFDERAQALKRTRKSMLRGNPSARSARYDDVLQRLKRRIDAHKPN
ncbi:MAG: hypothetical protein ACOYIE_09835, partial [Agathobaculum sp.]